MHCLLNNRYQATYNEGMMEDCGGKMILLIAHKKIGKVGKSEQPIIDPR